MVSTPLYDRFVSPAPQAHAEEGGAYPSRSGLRMLRATRWPHIRLALRPARSNDGDALQTYVRGLSPQSRYNRFLGAANELPPLELARTLAANGRDTLTLLLTSTEEDHETIVGEARAALSCAGRAGEFSMSIADAWRHLGVGSALLEEIEHRAAADGIELLFGDTLRTNEGMIGLACSRGFQLAPGFEPRLVRIEKRLDDVAPDLPCRKWNEVASGVELRTA
jgi:GNAT superfamily N-acetyltransferase